jgi:hypothetical protein
MDARHPGSRFILSVRDPETWVASNVRHFGTRETQMRRLIYGAGCPQGNEAVYVERMLRHNREVAEHFADRPDDLLTIDVTRNGAWAPICGFLGHPVPAAPFPHANDGRARALRRDGGLVGRVAAAFVTRRSRRGLYPPDDPV